MYINADLSITFTFDDEGKQRIGEAIETIQKINGLIYKMGTHHEYERDNLNNAVSILKTILEDKTLT